jgi:LysM repeat protein
MAIHRVKRGQTIMSLADQYQMDPQKILEANLGVNKLYPGMDINVPLDKIGNALNAAFSNIGNNLGSAFQGLFPTKPAYNPNIVVPGAAPINPQPAPALPGPRISNVQITQEAAQQDYRLSIISAQVKQTLQGAVNGLNPWPQQITAADIQLAYPGWTPAKTAQAMKAAGYVFDAASGAYRHSGNGALAGGGFQRGDVINYGEAGAIVATGENSGYLKTYSSGRAVNYGVSGTKHKVVNSDGFALTVSTRHTSGNPGKQSLEDKFNNIMNRGGPRNWKQRSVVENYLKSHSAPSNSAPAVTEPSYNGPAGSVGLVWRVGS